MKRELLVRRLENMLSIYRHMRWDFSYTERAMVDIGKLNAKIDVLVNDTVDNITHDLKVGDNVSL